MDSSFGSVRSAESPRPSLSTVSYESAIALANSAKNWAEMQHSDASLSTRKRTIVLLMGHRLTNKMVVRQLSIARETVKSHAKRIFFKLTVRTRPKRSIEHQRSASFERRG